MPKNDNATKATDSSAAKSSGRMARRKRATRAKLLEAAYKVMSSKGIDAAKLQEITDEADVGFGTFYNYFSDKDELAVQVLDCIINDMGRRNDVATADLKESNPTLVLPTSMRLVVREALEDPMWQWWVRRPDLLVDRMRVGFKPFGVRDLQIGLDLGIYSIVGSDAETAWNVLIWMLVGSMRDVVMGDYPPKHKNLMIEAILRVVGVPLDECEAMANFPLPRYPVADIDFSFSLEASQEHNNAA